MRHRTLLAILLSSLLATFLAAEKSEAERPKVIRRVCTDRICGGCDGQCTKADGHVALSRRGHCACTPDEGSALDQATRQSFREQERGR